MIDLVETFLTGRREPPLRPLRGREMYGPAEDDAQPSGPLRDLATDLEGLAIGIVYFDASGGRSERSIRCLKLREHNGLHYIDAWCKLRDAQRSFRVDRIAEIIDYSTGEVIDDVMGFLEPYFESLEIVPIRAAKPKSGPTAAAAFRAFRDGARVLLFVSMADGELHPTEAAIINAYAVDRIRRFAPETAEPEAIAARWIGNQSPTRNAAMAALRAVLDDAEHGRDLAHAIIDLIAVDGIVTDEEMATAWDLVKVIERRGRRDREKIGKFGAR